MKNKEFKLKALKLGALVLPFLLSGCFTGSTTGTGSGSPNSNDQNYTGYLVQVENDAHFETLLKSSLQLSSAPEETEVDRMETPSQVEADSDSSEAYSETTLIEKGVDEMDLVKFDGDIIYQTHQSDTGRNQVRLLKVPAGAASSSVVATIQTDTADNSRISGLYLYQKDSTKTLVIISEQYQYQNPVCGSGDEDCLIALTRPVYWARNRFVIDYYDVTDAENPVFSRSRKFEGSFLQSRRIDQRLYTISSLHIGIRGFDYAAEIESDIKSNNTLLEDISFQDLVPQVSNQDDSKSTWFGSRNCYVPEGITTSVYQLQLTVITSSDIETGETNASCFLGYSADFYASTSSLYFTEGFDWWSEDTRIHQFDFNETGVVYAGSGTVIGRIGGNFKMSEDEGYLRVISSNQNFNILVEPANDVGSVNSLSLEEVPGAEHYLSILKKASSKKELELVSRIPNKEDDTRIGKDGESIFATRFINDRAYVVTFLRTDPFYIIDLSNPLAPKVTGELEIPGLSTQLFPVTENMILGIGQESGLKLDLYDVSDISNPLRSDQYLFGSNLYSPALYDHHSIAMLYDQSSESMKVALPAQSWGFTTDSLSAGLYLFDVNAAQGTIELSGSLITRNNDKLGTAWNSAYDTRSIIDGDNFHYVTPEPVYSAPWSDPNDVSITP